MPFRSSPMKKRHAFFNQHFILFLHSTISSISSFNNLFYFFIQQFILWSPLFSSPYTNASPGQCRYSNSSYPKNALGKRVMQVQQYQLRKQMHWVKE